MRLKTAFFAALLSYSPSSFCTEALKETHEKLESISEDISESVENTRWRRSQNTYFALANYSPIDLLIPSKVGLSLGLLRGADHSWELELLRGSITPFFIEDLGKMTDVRFSLIRRSYFGSNSFNISYGLSYFDFSVNIGNDLMNRINGSYPPSARVMDLQSIGFNLAFGHRWSLKHNITVGVDWVSWAQPVLLTRKEAVFLDYVENAEDRKNAKRVVDWASYFPRLTFFKMQVGILF